MESVSGISKEISSDDVEKAFAEDWFTVVYQPQFSLSRDTGFTGAEAFVRLKHPEHGLMIPGAFLPMVDSMHKMRELTERVVALVANDWIALSEQGTDINVAINVDRSLLHIDGFGKALGKTLKQHKVPRQKITLEFTGLLEPDFLSETVRKSLMELHLKGFCISLDGFSVAESSQSLPDDVVIDEIKLDRDLVKSLLTKERCKDAMRSAMHNANRFSMRVVAVGIEDEETADFLARNGCDRGQGYYFGTPEEFSTLRDTYVEGADERHSGAERANILIVEDDVQYLNLLNESLSDNYNVRTTDCLRGAREALQDFSPDIVIIDLNLPDGRGVDLSGSGELGDNVSTIFISGAKEFASRLEAYEAGGMDFIEKPFSIRELMAKIRQMATYQLRSRDMSDRNKESQQMVMRSLQQTAYYGDIVQFFKNILVCTDEEQLSREFFRFSAGKGLRTAIEFRSKNTVSSYDQDMGVCSPTEVNIFEVLKEKGRLYEFAQRMMVNDDHVSFLVKNVPVDSVEKGELRDYVAVLVEALEARYREILRQRIVNEATEVMQELVQQLLSLVNVDSGEKKELLDDYSMELKMSFHVLQLTLEQENYLTDIIEKMLNHNEAAEKSTVEISNTVEYILKQMATDLAELEVKAPAAEEESAGGSTVELF
ncbi:EAL domain-containing protein [Gilvimarinus sp. SDUM040013]|uniref:EAL domain-containing protein n=1 Tax=Gilvimarinus gilvus TaxID=3058038 RepID=A0ABU4S0J5_9GAMM|nr:EAL domain-containing protein [Gilvimarinus sp. SDUM040013]MDO3384895.1 EAL domain-containing protein [Gilvimarinus sp. SDUM040013]MDX6850680.1 EAL domain-containing protein [Gilvimarinus sp. SDUM040013]